MASSPVQLSLYDLVQKINTQYAGMELPASVKKMKAD